MEHDKLIAELLDGAKAGSKESRAAAVIDALQRKAEELVLANSTLVMARNQAALELVNCEREKAALAGAPK